MTMMIDMMKRNQEQIKTRKTDKKLGDKNKKGHTMKIVLLSMNETAAGCRLESPTGVED